MKDGLSGDSVYLWDLLRNTRDAILRVRERELREYGLSETRACVLFNIATTHDKQPTPTEISRHLLRRSHSVSSMLSRMERQGLVTKANDLHRKNMVRVFLTDKGWQLYHQAAKRESIHMIMSCLSDEEGRQLVSSLKKLRNQALKEFEIEERVHSVA